MHLQQREERLVERVRRHRRLRQHRDLRAHARVGNDGLAGGRRHGLDDLADLRVFEVRRDALAVVAVFWALDDAGGGERQQHDQQARAEGLSVIIEYRRRMRAP